MQADAARKKFKLTAKQEPTEVQLKEAAKPIKLAATKALMGAPALRTLLVDLKQKFEQVVDTVSIDQLKQEETGYGPEAKDRAKKLVDSFEKFLAANKRELDALRFFYSVPHRKRLRYADIKALADAISAPPRSWTPEQLWHAYQTLEQAKVHGASAGRLLTDVVSLVRFALHQEDELVPHAERVQDRYENWLAQQANKGRTFTDEERRWLDMMKGHIAASVEMDTDDFDLTPFVEEGGLAKARKVFGKELPTVVRELNEVLAA